MAYATVDELAAVLRVKVNDANRGALDVCLEAAADEIDHELAGSLPVPNSPILNRANLNRAVEWWKATDAAYGIVGIDEIGQLRIPRDGFARHAATLVPLKHSWGVG